MTRQLSLFQPEGNPTWEDVQKGRAEFVPHERYGERCRESCQWHGSIFERMGEPTCYLFAKPVIDGMRPSSGRLEWKDVS